MLLGRYVCDAFALEILEVSGIIFTEKWKIIKNLEKVLLL